MTLNLDITMNHHPLALWNMVQRIIRYEFNRGRISLEAELHVYSPSDSSCDIKATLGISSTAVHTILHEHLLVQKYNLWKKFFKDTWMCELNRAHFRKTFLIHQIKFTFLVHNIHHKCDLFLFCVFILFVF